MKDIHEVLRRKQAKYAQLGKQIEMLQQAAEKLREVAPLLAEMEEDDGAVLADVDEPANSLSAKAGASGGNQGAPAKGARTSAPRWP
jgi:prefoldin subunit 5